MKMERVTLNTNGLCNVIFGIREDSSLENKLKRKIDDQAEEVKKEVLEGVELVGEFINTSN